MQDLSVVDVLEAKAELHKPVKNDSLRQKDLLTFQCCAQVSCGTLVSGKKWWWAVLYLKKFCDQIYNIKCCGIIELNAMEGKVWHPHLQSSTLKRCTVCRPAERLPCRRPHLDVSMPRGAAAPQHKNHCLT